MKPYSILSPVYSPTSGGVKVMYALYGWLLAKGQEVYLNEYPRQGDYIGIYPEIAHGNPFKASTVIRYILNKPGLMEAIDENGKGTAGPKSFDPSDRLYYFSQLFSDDPVDANHLLFLPVIDLHTFYVQKGVIRKNKCKFVGKGYDTHSKETEGLFSLDRQFARDQKQLADYLNTCEVMYCFDTCSAMTEVARLCGCRVVMLNNTLYTKEKFRQYEPGMNGISWGIEEENKLDAEQFRQAYKHLYRMAEHSIDVFIEDTQNENN